MLRIYAPGLHLYLGCKCGNNFFFLAANVYELSRQALLETHGSFLILFSIPVIVVVGVVIRMYFEGPSCPSSAKLTGTFLHVVLYTVKPVYSGHSWQGDGYNTG